MRYLICRIIKNKCIVLELEWSKFNELVKGEKCIFRNSETDKCKYYKVDNFGILPKDYNVKILEQEEIEIFLGKRLEGIDCDITIDSKHIIVVNKDEDPFPIKINKEDLDKAVFINNIIKSGMFYLYEKKKELELERIKNYIKTTFMVSSDWE